MGLLIKLLVFFGVLLNFVGSVRLLKSYRDVLQIPYFKWEVKDFAKNFESILDSEGKRTNSLNQISKVLYQKLLVKRHDSLRAAMGLSRNLIVEGGKLSRSAIHVSLSEIAGAIEEWRNESDPDARLDQKLAVWLFIAGFAFLLMASLLDLVSYLVGD